MDEINNIEKEDLSSPELDRTGKENPFLVPDNYFEELPGIISQKIRQANKKTVSLSFRRDLVKALAVAASALLFYFILHEQKNTVILSTPVVASTEADDCNAYLAYLVDNNELDESLIVNALIIDDTAKKQDNRVNNGSMENPVFLNDTNNTAPITREDIIQYLMESDDNDDLLN